METTYVSPSLIPGPFGKGGLVTGIVEPGWEPVRRAFEENFRLNYELGAQLVVYSQDKVVVDLCGRSDAQAEYTAETLQNIYSSGKNMEALCIAVLVDRGLVAYRDKISQYWPEFGRHGKEDITVADALRHEGGVPFFTSPLSNADFKTDHKLTENEITDPVAIEKVIENSALFNLDGQRHYHALTRGWILSGLIRRVDHKHRTLGQFMSDEICAPMGLTIYCGMSPPQQQNHHFANVAIIPNNYALPFLVVPVKAGLGDPTIRGALEIVFGKNSPMRRHSESLDLACLHLPCRIQNVINFICSCTMI